MIVSLAASRDAAFFLSQRDTCVRQGRGHPKTRRSSGESTGAKTNLMWRFPLAGCASSPECVFHSRMPLNIPSAYQNISPHHLSVPPGHLALPIRLLTPPPDELSVPICPLSVRLESLAVWIKPLSMPPEHLAMPI